ncbi:NADH:flavin oxidoreductase [Spirosoma sp. KCTC 42546]|uniref:oxidoreductase n=1 Tax=Spirosoma sp. KCTC 42546 TaxID=2520506 RepID=UPI001159B44B|nr:NADH:flavin oxidoreductase [Spirosoma sp. KCTC 42546]QDK83233.1 NADH:flavin oxidoreductase [Spirosoma sp. KCTC 42546]
MSEKYKPQFPRMAQLKTAADLGNYLTKNDIGLPFDDVLLPAAESPFNRPIPLKSGQTIGNSLCILPMEGWDGTLDGRPTDFTRNRWKKFAISGAKLLFGCEAVAVCHSGKANPNQLVMNDETFLDFVELRQLVLNAHTEAFGKTDDLVIGLQLTHSGRFCKPRSHKAFESKILYSHPFLNSKFGMPADYPLLTDEEIDQIIQQYIDAAVLAQKAGFDFVDVKHCHGYLGHEFLSAVSREGRYGGSFENRTRYLRNIVAGIREAAPGLGIGIRLSAFDLLPFKKGPAGAGIPESAEEYPFAFGGKSNGLELDLTETKALLTLAESLGIQLVCITGGSPYYNPHLMRPALFPPSDGYLPPEDPLLGVKRQIDVTNELKQAFPELVIIGSGYSYLQEWLPNVAQYVLRNGMADSIGFGRMVLSYPTMPADMLEGRPLVRNHICRTFSDCTTAPRNGLISGCYPLDPLYKKSPEAEELKAIKESL